MKIVIAPVGRAKEREVRALIDDYYARIRRYAQLDEVEIDDGKREDKVIEAVERVLATHKGRAELVALEVTGRAFSSEQFAKKLGERMESAVVPVFVIGGAEGIPEALSARAAWKVSLGPMTLPHRLARLILAEQVYRAFTILRGEPYAREG
ncbi:MAG: 23S rRNA (pseudouridine(1915)-N(3))-methyltransferase RlmH [Myxococcales bacterium]|nr:23S rRNA (pseudouridine(1915)-N(3))-methyltransferase RlmH [Myxococcales bacterium]